MTFVHLWSLQQTAVSCYLKVCQCVWKELSLFCCADVWTEFSYINKCTVYFKIIGRKCQIPCNYEQSMGKSDTSRSCLPPVFCWGDPERSSGGWHFCRRVVAAVTTGVTATTLTRTVYRRTGSRSCRTWWGFVREGHLNLVTPGLSDTSPTTMMMIMIREVGSEWPKVSQKWQ